VIIAKTNKNLTFSTLFPIYGKILDFKNILRMNINELFEKIQDEFSFDELKGEFLLQGNCIVWSYNLEEDTEEIDYQDDDEEFSFETTSSEELLQEAYQEDLEKLNELLDEIEETSNWNISDFESTENIISFKVF